MLKAQRLSGGESDYDGLLELIGEASVVHIGRPRTARTSSTASAPASPAA